MKQELVRSNTRSVYKADADDTLVAKHEGIQRIAQLIETRRVEQLNKDRRPVSSGPNSWLRLSG